MRVYLMTDLEGVAGVQNSLEWTRPGQYWYDLARQLLTQEANAAVAGFIAAGADEVLVADGHGPGAVYAAARSCTGRAGYWPLPRYRGAGPCARERPPSGCPTRR